MYGRPIILRVAARTLGIAGALYGSFLIVILGALSALDAGPAPSPLLEYGAPLVVVGLAIPAAVVLRRRRALAAGLFAIAALVEAAGLLALDAKPYVLAVPAVVLVAAGLAWSSRGADR